MVYKSDYHLLTWLTGKLMMMFIKQFAVCHVIL